MKIKLPVTWQVSGFVEVEAENIQDAILNFDAADHNLPTDEEYVDGSFELSTDDVECVEAMQ